MTTREQITFEKLETLLNYLENEGVLDSNWRESISQIDSPEKGRKSRENAKNGNGPPNFAENE